MITESKLALALVALVKSGMPDIRDVQIGPATYTEEKLRQVIRNTPFCRVCYMGLIPSERTGSGETINPKHTFTFLIGHHDGSSDQKAEIAVMDLLTDLRTLLDGQTVAVGDERSDGFELEGQFPEINSLGFSVYSAVYSVWQL